MVSVGLWLFYFLSADMVEYFEVVVFFVHIKKKRKKRNHQVTCADFKIYTIKFLVVFAQVGKKIVLNGYGWTRMKDEWHLKQLNHFYEPLMMRTLVVLWGLTRVMNTVEIDSDVHVSFAAVFTGSSRVSGSVVLMWSSQQRPAVWWCAASFQSSSLFLYSVKCTTMSNAEQLRREPRVVNPILSTS